MITAATLAACMPRAGAKAALFAPHLAGAMHMFRIKERRDVTAFLATIAAESGELHHLAENMNYSAEALMKTWPARFMTIAFAKQYHRQPEKIANYVYANRMGNGDEKSGDGWRTRGAGLIQLTGTVNQNACAKYFARDPKTVGDWLRTPEGACYSAAWFWVTRGCQQWALADDFDAVCDLVNIGRRTAARGDAIGFSHRLAHLKHIRTIIKE